MGFKVRSFRSADASGIVDLHKNFNSHFEESELTLDYVLNCSLRHDFRFFIVEHEEKVVGFSGVLYHESVGRAELGPICVSSEHQGNGVGSLLVDTVISFLANKNVHRVIAKVKVNNNGGVRFFQSKGFKPEASLTKYTRRGEDAIQLVTFL